MFIDWLPISLVQKKLKKRKILAIDDKVLLKRNAITFESKVDILDHPSKGESVSAVARSLKLNESSTRTIKKNESAIRQVVGVGSSTSLF